MCQRTRIDFSDVMCTSDNVSKLRLPFFDSASRKADFGVCKRRSWRVVARDTDQVLQGSNSAFAVLMADPFGGGDVSSCPISLYTYNGPYKFWLTQSAFQDLRDPPKRHRSKAAGGED